ncbi:MAG TPA: hypothetical protein VGE18_02200 [Candidatus Paceibacterota bacterium]
MANGSAKGFLKFIALLALAAVIVWGVWYWGVRKRELSEPTVAKIKKPLVEITIPKNRNREVEELKEALAYARAEVTRLYMERDSLALLLEQSRNRPRTATVSRRAVTRSSYPVYSSRRIRRPGISPEEWQRLLCPR